MASHQSFTRLEDARKFLEGRGFCEHPRDALLWSRPEFYHVDGGGYAPGGTTHARLSPWAGAWQVSYTYTPEEG